jgi:hypothetical protein
MYQMLVAGRRNAASAAGRANRILAGRERLKTRAVVDFVDTTWLPNHQATITLAATTTIGRLVIPLALVDSGSQAGNEAHACRLAPAAVESIATELRGQLSWER